MNDRSEPSDRRLDRRIPLGSEAAILLAHGDRIEAECMELSVSGMTLRAPYVPGESEVITVEVAPPPASGIERPPLLVRLAVLRCHPLDDGRYEIGGTTIEIIG